MKYNKQSEWAVHLIYVEVSRTRLNALLKETVSVYY